MSKAGRMALKDSIFTRCMLPVSKALFSKSIPSSTTSSSKMVAWEAFLSTEYSKHLWVLNQSGLKDLFLVPTNTEGIEQLIDWAEQAFHGT